MVFGLANLLGLGLSPVGVKSVEDIMTAALSRRIGGHWEDGQAVYITGVLSGGGEGEDC